MDIKLLHIKYWVAHELLIVINEKDIMYHWYTKVDYLEDV